MEEIRIVESPNYVHLFSGGLDSTYGLLKLTNDIEKGIKRKGSIHPVFIDYGHFAASVEWTQAQKIVEFIGTRVQAPSVVCTPIRIDLKSDLFTWCHNVAFTGKEFGETTCEIQNRNMVLLSTLFSYLLACAQNQGIEKASFEIYGGFKEGEMEDCKQKFFNALTDVFAIYQKRFPMKVVLLQPFNIC
jgi:7-cyano-7-deazaguanine synthase in queuosine biosynthesis